MARFLLSVLLGPLQASYSCDTSEFIARALFKAKQLIVVGRAMLRYYELTLVIERNLLPVLLAVYTPKPHGERANS